MRLLLINPRTPESFWSFRFALDRIVPGKRALNPPLGLATLAALCPAHWQVTIVDENVETIPTAPEADLVGICGMGVQFSRARELLSYYRRKGYRTVVGGSYASLCPDKFSDLADVTVAGEAEYIWPRFCRDFENGAHERLYVESGTVAMADSPVPRFDLLKLPRYNTASIQFSRGCPYLCEFCDIIVMFGRRPRMKGVEQIGRELDVLRAMRVHQVFFVDDNLIGNRAQAKALLRYLIDYQRQHGYRFSFGTEASLNLAQDGELMDLMRAANFGWVFIGIETPDEATLKSTRKVQNVGTDILGDLRAIYSRGIDVLAGFIVGFDADTVETFDRQRQFILASGIQAAMVGLLTALPRTPLFERLKRENRLIADADDTDNTRLGTNFIPKGMPYAAMVEGYQKLYASLLTDRAISLRIRNKMRWMRSPVYQGEYGAIDKVRIAARLVARGIFVGGPSRWYAFARSIPWTSPSGLPMVLSDWITGLSMRAYVHRRFALLAPSSDGTERPLLALRTLASRWLGTEAMALNEGPEGFHLSLSLGATMTSTLRRRLARALAQLLRTSQTRLTLHLDLIHTSHVPQFQRLLRALASHGDRISVILSEAHQEHVRVDSSVFHLSLVPLPSAGG